MRDRPWCFAALFIAFVLSLAVPVPLAGYGALEARDARPFTVLGMRLGTERPDDVWTILLAAGATVTESPAAAVTPMQLEARNGNYRGIDPRHDYVLLEFTRPEPQVLASLTISYGNATQQTETARMNELARTYGTSDGGEAMAWNKVVNGVRITLHRDQATGELTEKYLPNK